MTNGMLADRIRDYQPQNALEQENALVEILQHYVLAGLARSGLFRRAIFHGGTYLRILHSIDRFSEDLDFIQKETDTSFVWTDYLKSLERFFTAEGMLFEATDRSKTESNVRKAFLKTDSIGTGLQVGLPFRRQASKKIRIKLELDTNPPTGSGIETKFLTFPYPASITSLDLSSSFSLKLHALLCRPYAKGRDWFDLLWYVRRRTPVNFPLLTSALNQVGPWEGRHPSIDHQWLRRAMQDRIASIDWDDARRDVRRFLPARQQAGLESWTSELFLQVAAEIPSGF